MYLLILETNKHFYFLDIETNSDSLKFDKDTHEIIQIGIYDSESGEKFSEIINIGRPLSENIKRLTGISDEDISNGVDLKTALDHAIDFLGDKEKAVIVGHNLENFDLYVLSKFDSRFKEYKYMDTLFLFLFLYPGFKTYTVQDLYKRFIKSDYSEKHQALQDAIDESELFYKLLNRDYLDKYYKSNGKDLGFLKDIINKYDGGLSSMSYNMEYIKQILDGLEITSTTGFKSKLLEKWFFNYDKVNTDDEERLITRSPDPENTIKTDEMNMIYDKFLEKTNNTKRDAQLSMMQHIKDVLNGDNKDLFVEAGTGTGKTYGYLLPAITYIKKNKPSKKLKIFIATYTKVLQEQLMEKDIPLIKKLYPDVRFELLKADSEAISLDLVPFKGSLSFGNIVLWNWLYRGNFHLSDIHYSVQLMIGTDKLSSYNSSLPTINNYDRKYGFKGKLERQLRDGNIFIINQAFLIAKFNPLLKNTYTELVSTKIFPTIRIDEKYYAKFIIDEGHNLESVIREYLTLDFTKLRFDYIMNIFSNTSNFNLLTFVDRQLDKMKQKGEMNQDPEYQKSLDIRIEQISLIRKLFEERISGQEHEVMIKLHRCFISNFPKTRFCNIAINDIKELRNQGYDTTISEYDKKSFNDRYQSNDLLNYLNYSQKVIEELLHSIDGRINNTTHYEELDDIKNFIGGFFTYFRIGAILANTEYNDKKYFFNARVELSEENLDLKNFGFTAIPLYLSNGSRFLEYSKGNIVLSATLFDKGTESYVLREVFENDYNSAKIQKFKTPFDYINQRKIYCTETDDKTKIDNIMHEFIEKYHGRSLILANTTAEKRRLAQECKERYSKKGILTLMHVSGSMASSTNQKNVQNLRDNPNTILVGSKSYAEGVDVPGDNLKLVILNRLPYLPPTPFIKLQDKKWKSKGDRFVYKFLCSIDFRQSIGRLIRTKTDTGDILILDERLLRDPGKFFRDYIEGEKIIKIS